MKKQRFVPSEPIITKAERGSDYITGMSSKIKPIDKSIITILNKEKGIVLTNDSTWGGPGVWVLFENQMIALVAEKDIRSLLKS